MNNNSRLPLVNSYIDKWAKESPEAVAIVQHEDGREFTYKKFGSLIDFFALKLIDMDLQKGDRVATQLVLVPEHMALMYACFKIGVIFAPLDIRLTENEVVRDINKIEAKVFFFLGDTPVKDFRIVGKAVKEKCSSVKHLVQFTPDPKPGDIIQGAMGITQLMNKPRLIWLKLMDMFSSRLKNIYQTIEKRTPALIIYTTGTTGEPKPAVLCHENIIAQNQVLERGIDYKGDLKDFSILVNLPPSHVGCITETFMTTMFMGGKAVFLRIFDIKATLEAIERHKIKVIGQIPTMFRMLWSFPEYKTYDLSSLEFVAYAGSAVDTGFLKKLSKMAPKFGTGIGMTENAGFATFTPADIPIEEMAGQVGRAFSDIARVSIRNTMKENGAAGEELPDGEIGEICYHPPIVFLGYYNQPEETKKAVSTEGILYTGDLGYFKQMDGYKALYLAGRKKFIIKQKGYNVFPGEIEEHIARMDNVDVVDVIGMKHQLFDEGIFAFVRPTSDTKLSSKEVMAHCKSIASYKRPQHVEIWPCDKELPLTRSTKVDKLKLMETALPIINRLRDKGRWDTN